METTVQLGKGKYVTVYTTFEDGRITIETNALPKIVCLNAGVPGLFGPTVEYDIQELHDQDEAKLREHSAKGEF